MVERDELIGIWNYFLSLEQDLDETSRFVEPRGQENVYSFEFAKILILSCTEIESVFKHICKVVANTSVGTMADYKSIILNRFPRITEAKVSVRRLGTSIYPFMGWDTGKLSWWDAYQKVKHDRGMHFTDATYRNVLYSVAALYILIFYLAKCTDIGFDDAKSVYVGSEYEHCYVYFGPTKQLPDFSESSDKTSKEN